MNDMAMTPTASWIRTTNSMRTLMERFRLDNEAALEDKNLEKALSEV